MPVATTERVEASENPAGNSSDGSADRFMRRLLRVDKQQEQASLLAARSALGSSIVISGARCFLTYLVFPLLAPSFGAVTAIGGYLTVLLGAVAVFFSVTSMRRFWAADHRHRWTYTAFAGVIVIWVITDLSIRAFRVVG